MDRQAPRALTARQERLLGMARRAEPAHVAQQELRAPGAALQREPALTVQRELPVRKAGQELPRLAEVPERPQVKVLQEPVEGAALQTPPATVDPARQELTAEPPAEGRAAGVPVCHAR
jgi:hypothetical protein